MPKFSKNYYGGVYNTLFIWGFIGGFINFIKVRLKFYFQGRLIGLAPKFLWPKKPKNLAIITPIIIRTDSLGGINF